MDTARRKFPRVAFKAKGEMVLARDQRAIPVTVLSVSPGGMGVRLRLPTALGGAIACDDRVQVKFAADHSTIELPARIAWLSDDAASGGPEVGVRLQLHEAERDQRRSYAKWVVDLLSASPAA
jgi:hypothetical protein